MGVRYIFNTSGEYVAFVRNGHVFDRNSKWIGFIPTGNEVYDLQGEFLGYVLDDDRIARSRYEIPKLRRWKPIPPLPPIPPILPLRRLRMIPLPPPLIDVFEKGSSTAVS